MQPLRDRSICQKINLVILVISSAVLLLTCAALFAVQAWSIKKSFTRQLTVLGKIIANNLEGAAISRDARPAMQTLTGLNAMPEIISACIILNDGSRLAQFGSAHPAEEISTRGLEAECRIKGSRVLLAEPVQRDGQRLGTLLVHADFRSVYRDLLELYAGILVAVLGASLLLAFLLSRHLQKFVTEPILRLAGTAQQIAEGKDFAVRAEPTGHDEVGVLTDAFNRMLSQIQAQDTALQRAQKQLWDQLKSLQREVVERKRAQAAQAQLAAIINGTPDFVGTADAVGRVRYLNPAARRMIGVDDGLDVASLKVSDLHPGWAARIVSTEGIPGAIHDGSWAGETAAKHRDGREIHVSHVIIAHKNPQGGLEQLSMVMRDISERKVAEEALRISQQKLLETSRLAGMAEVATGVLHNVGNVLNSVNVSAGLVLDKLRRSKVPKLSKAAELLTACNGSLAEYLTQDPNGQKLPGYLEKLGRYLVAENTELLGEVQQLARNIEHIKEVVAMQQSYAKVSGVFEDLEADRLVEDAIAMNIGAFERHGVKVERRFSPAPMVHVDRHRVLQILINLIRNAKYALDDVQRSDKQITISIAPTDQGNVRIGVADNGIGIPAENLTRLFGHGFTTRKEGHGFGLHSGANSAKEMRGSLTVHSDGIGQGATFTLELPVNPPESSK